MPRQYRAINARQTGFTLLELMVAGTVSLLLFAVMWQMLNNTVFLTETMFSRVTMNQEARAAFRMITYGAAVDVDASGDLVDAEIIAGIHGSASVLAGSATAPILARQTSIGRVDQRLHLVNLATNQSVLGYSIQVTIDCTAAGEPHPECINAATDLDVNGVLSANPALASTATFVSASVDRCGGNNQNAVVVDLDFTNPVLATKDDDYAASEYSNRYRFIAVNHVDCIQ